jgi:hypothetical protein
MLSPKALLTVSSVAAICIVHSFCLLSCSRSASAKIAGVFEGQDGSFIESYDLRPNGVAILKIRPAPYPSEAMQQLMGKVIEDACSAESFSSGNWFAGEQGVEVTGRNLKNQERKSIFTLEPNGDIVLREGRTPGVRYKRIITY